MKRLKRILQWTVGLLLGGYFTIWLLFSFPFVQRWIAGMAGNFLSDYLGARVELGRVQVGLPFRVIVDDLCAFDRQGKEMLRVSRAGVKLDLLTLLRDKEVEINHVLLFGAHANIYQQHPDSALNIQFVIDAFQNKDKQKEPLPQISINSVLVRHATAHFDQLWKEETPGKFNPAHLLVKELNLAAQLNALTDDTLSVTLRRLSLVEECGIQIKSGQSRLTRGREGVCISDFLLTLPASEVEIPWLSFSLEQKSAQGTLAATVTPADAKAFFPPLASVATPIITSFSFVADSLAAEVRDFKLSAEDDAVEMDIPLLAASNLQTAFSRIKSKEGGLIDKLPDITVQLERLQVTPDIMSYITPFVEIVPEKLEQMLRALGKTVLQVNATYSKGEASGDMALQAQLGDIDVSASYADRRIKGKVRADGFDAAPLFALGDSSQILGKVSLTVEADVVLPASGNNAYKNNVSGKHKAYAFLEKIPTGSLTATIHEAFVKGYTYRDISLSASNHKGGCDINLTANDPSLSLDLQGHGRIAPDHNEIQALLDVRHFRPVALALTQKGVQDVALKMGVNLRGEQLDNMAGDISIPHVILSDKQGTFTLASLQLESMGQGSHRDVAFHSPYFEASAKGMFKFEDLVHFAHHTIHTWIPGIVKAPAVRYDDCDAQFSFALLDPSPLERIAGVSLLLSEGPFRMQLEANSRQQVLNLQAEAPCIDFNGQQFHDFRFDTRSQGEQMTTAIHANKTLRDTPFDLDVNIAAGDKQLSAHINWNSPEEGPQNSGSIAFRGNMKRVSSSFAIDGEFLPTIIHINDTTWNVQSTPITFRDGVLNIKDFRLTMNEGQRWLAINGRASKSEKDTLFVNLREIELAYIFDLARVKPIKLGGLATGKVTGTTLFSSPQAKADVVVPNLLFNRAEMGFCHGLLSWDMSKGNLGLDVRIDDTPNRSWVNAQGHLHLIKDPIQNLDLNIDCQRVNTHFLEHYVNGIMTDIQGRTTGKLRVYGNFGEINLYGDAQVEEAELTVPTMNVRYHVKDEYISVRPDGIQMQNVTVYDPYGNPDVSDHRGLLNGEITFRHFRDMKYDVKISGENILAYNFPDFEDLPFCGVVYGTGDVHVHGYPGSVNIDINARPTQSTFLTYKVASPETITQSKFITFRDRSVVEDSEESKAPEAEVVEGDMRMNFDLDVTPDAELRLLMDPAAGDYISLYGNARLRASYYNKGNFRMYGTYRVDRGTYRMSIKDIIRKEFQFRKDGYIVFGGNPFEADLNLQAVYTVPSVSLNDLSVRGTFSNSSVRVNCLMNLGGKAGEPRVTFDFDIPNVNEDELRMVRSLLSTEEEQNLQVIYLLGIGRFYTNDYANAQTQSSAAMNSLLSSTLSGQINQMFNNMMGGNQNWNIGANLSTGELGWSDMDVEGMLSGRLLNNRLLINGNFGYRDNPVAASNFIGDFDLQWLLNRQGNLILKAYSETNDRYFTKSSLTTQGLGILVKKDFARWRDLFKWKKRNK